MECLIVSLMWGLGILTYLIRKRLRIRKARKAQEPPPGWTINLALIRSDIHWSHVTGRSEIESPVRMHGFMHGDARLGAYSYVQSDCQIDSAWIGRFCSIARAVSTGLGEPPTDWLSTHPFVTDPGDHAAKLSVQDPGYMDWLVAPVQPFPGKGRTIIGHDVWIGHRPIIGSGVTVGDGAIIGAGALVMRDVLPFEIVGGVPAKRLRFRFDEETRAELLDLRWWDYDLSVIGPDIDYANVSEAIRKIREAIRSGRLPKLDPPRWQVTSDGARPLNEACDHVPDGTQ